MQTAKARYSKLEGARHPYLSRARDCSGLTLPYLMPPEGDNTGLRFPTPYQSIGARGVNNLASALLLSLLPPNAPFFRFILDSSASRKLQELSPNAKGEVETKLSELEGMINREIESLGIRATLFEAIKQLIVSGSVVLYLSNEGPMRTIRMDRFVVRRDPMGKVLELIIKETISPSSLPDEVLGVVSQQGGGQPFETVDIYTTANVISKGKVEVYQEVGGVIIPGTYATYAEDRSPFMALRMNRVDGESYGRSYVEQYLGDLNSLEGLNRSIVEAAAATSKILFLVNPAGFTRARTLSEAPNGAIVEGNAQDVTVLQTAKGQDLMVAMQTAGGMSERLSYAFLLTEATIRNAERVTAEEVRLVTQSIERQLGGIYSILSQEFQLPLVNRVVDRLTKQKKMPKLPKDFVVPTIVTGIDALGRGNDLSRLDVFLQGIGQLLGPQAIGQYIDVREYMNRRAAALGIETAGLIKSDEQLAQEQQAAAQQQMMAQGAETAIDAGGQMAVNAMRPQ